MPPKFTAITFFITVALFVACSDAQEVTTDRSAHHLKLSLRDPSVLLISGKQRITCRSRWHDVRIPCKISGRLALTDDDLNRVLPDSEVAVGQGWEVKETASDALTKQIFSAIKISATDAEKYSHWTGNKPQPNPVEVNAELTGILRSVEGDGENQIANIRVTGDLHIIESGKMANRFGPNWWTTNWHLKLNVDLAVRTADGQLEKLQCSCKGIVKGVYSNQVGPELTEPFAATVDFRAVEIEPLSPDQRDRVDMLIEKLNDNKFAERERATRELRQFGPNISELLRHRIKSADSQEARSRLTRLASELSE